MNTESETLKNVMSVVTPIVALIIAAATIINSWLLKAKTSEQKSKILKNSFVLMWVIFCLADLLAALVCFILNETNLGMLLTLPIIVYFIGQFLFTRNPNFSRADVFWLIMDVAYIFFALLSYSLSKIIAAIQILATHGK